MKNRRNYYRILNVQPDAPLEVIKSSYRTMMLTMKMHPDMGGDTAQATLINEAFEILSNRDKRGQYDYRITHSSLDSIRVSAGNDNFGTGAQPDQLQGRPVEKSACLFCGAPVYASLKVNSACVQCNSPLKGMEVDGPSKKRQFKRITSSGELKFFESWPSDGGVGYSEDISPTGMRFITGQYVEVDKIIKISMGSLEAVAQVKNRYVQQQDDYRFQSLGVCFLSLDMERSPGMYVSRFA